MKRTSLITHEKSKIVLFFFLLFCALFADAQPVLEWYKQTSSGSSEQSSQVVVDKLNNVYITGEVSSTVDFDNGPGIIPYQATVPNSFFICKYDFSGSLLWMKTLNLKMNHRILLDDSCNIIVSGYFAGTVDFDPDSGVFNMATSLSSGKLYVLKLDSSGAFIWAKNLNTLGNTTYPGIIKRDVQGNLYIGAEVASLCTLIKLDSDGNLLWTKSFGTTSCKFRDIGIDDSGNIIIEGVFSSIVDFDPDIGSTILDANSGKIFLTKWNSAGQLLWGKNFGGKNAPKAIAIDRNNRISTLGVLSDSADFDPGIGISTLFPISPYNDTFIVQFDSLGNYLWANTIKGSSFGNDICTDSLSNILVTGYIYGVVNFDLDTGVYTLPYYGYTMPFVCKYDADGHFKNAVAFGRVQGFSITSGLNNDVFITGAFTKICDMDPSGAVYNLQTPLEYSVFISTMDSSFNFKWAQSIVGGAIMVLAHHSDANGYSYTSGAFAGTVDFQPDSTLELYECLENNKIYIQKLNTEGNKVWLKVLEGGFERASQILESDISGNIYLLGVLTDTADMDPGPGVYNINLPPNSARAYFILKLDSSGNFVWAEVISKTPDFSIDSTNFISDMVVDGSGSIILYGTFQGLLDADPGPGTYNLVSPEFEIYILKLNSSGIFEWVKQIGNPNEYEESNSMKLDGFGNIYLSGVFIDDVDFDPGPGVYNESPNDWAPSFILKLNSNGEFIWVRQISFYDLNGSYTYTPELEVADDGTWYATSLFEGCLDFDPGPGIDTSWAQTNGHNYYITKWSANGSLIWKVISPPESVPYHFTTNLISLCRDNSNTVFWAIPGDSDLFKICKIDDSGSANWLLYPLASLFAFGEVDQHNNIYSYASLSKKTDFDFTAIDQDVTPIGINDVVIAKYHVNNPACSVSPTSIASNKVANTFCLGQDVVLTQIGGRLSDSGSFKWYTGSCGGALIGDGPSIVVTPNDTTTYFLRTEDSCGVSTCISITLYNKIPSPPPVITGNGLFCSGDSLYLDAGTGYVGYVWSTGSLTQTTSIISSGQYQVTVTDANGCTATTSITASTYPDPPLIVTPASAVNICLGDTVQFIANFDPGYTYQWYRNSYPISGANNYYFNAFSNGKYSVKVVDTNTCDSVSSSVRLRIVCFPPLDEELKISENDPKDAPIFSFNYEIGIEKLFLHAKQLAGRNYNLIIYDLSGREIYNSVGKIENSSLHHSVECSSFVNSIYLVTIKTESEQMKAKFVKY